MRIKNINPIDLQLFHHKKLLLVRRQDRVVQTEEFIFIWKKANVTERKEIVRLLKLVKPDRLIDYIDAKINENLVDRPIAELRSLASHYHIKNYSRKSRDQLAKEIKERQDYDSKRLQKQPRVIIKQNETSPVSRWGS
ncbi:MAG: Rho termination factor N-terminal domain-containing protein [Clostridia bacterium]|jgi:hypothetical protein